MRFRITHQELNDLKMLADAATCHFSAKVHYEGPSVKAEIGPMERQHGDYLPLIEIEVKEQ